MSIPKPVWSVHLLALVLVAGFLAAPTTVAVSLDHERMAQAMEDIENFAHFQLPDLDRGIFERLAKGRQVQLRIPAEGPEEPQTLIGLKLIDASREAVWLACQDSHFSAMKELVEAPLDTAGPALYWYGYMNLPWPLRNRHWVVEVADNQALAEHSGIWEHWWELRPAAMAEARAVVGKGALPELDLERFERAVELGVSEGAWLVIPLDSERSLLVFHARVAFGGHLPDRVVLSYSARGMKRLLGNIKRRAEREVRQHYNAEHPPLKGADGQPIARWPH